MIFPRPATLSRRRQIAISSLPVTALLAVLAGPTAAAPALLAAPPLAGPAEVTQVRLVCDQNCHCWRTAYQGPRTTQLAAVDDVNACPAGGRYNGHYRTGPSTGLNFENRDQKKSLFPFY